MPHGALHCLLFFSIIFIHQVWCCFLLPCYALPRHLASATLAETMCGSPLYMAPEILQSRRYNAKADLWSVGTILYEMLCGRPPFNGTSQMDLLRNIQTKELRIPAGISVSASCVKLLQGG